MAANEHKNLQDANRHNPKGFEAATNDTVLSKGASDGSGTTDGSLEYISKSLVGVTNYKMQGYIDSGLNNYSYGEDLADNKAPYQWDQDFGSAVVSSGSILPKSFFRAGSGHVVPFASTVQRIKGWLTSNGTNDITIAICKITPVVNNISNVVPVVIDEITVSGLGNDSKLVAFEETTITQASISAGDILFPMFKEAEGAGSTIFVNLTVETYTY
tara:strand:- start:9600 stop:10244 length:645 start_codon:yes stop_codon:yes gene_type:complete